MKPASETRWQLAQRHEELYQRRKAEDIRGSEVHVLASRAVHARAVRARIERHVPLDASTKVLEVGCGPHGVGFFLGTGDVVAVDPLADLYDGAFPWARTGANVRTVRACGEELPFEAASFNVVVTDNVLDHTRDPSQVLREIARVLRPGGVLFFAVNVHRWTGWALTQVHERIVAPLRAVSALAPHPFAFRTRDARALLTAAGFAITAETEEPHADHHHGGTGRSRARRVARAAFERAFPVAYFQAVCVRR